MMEVFSGNDGVVRSSRGQLSHEDLNQPLVKLAPLLYDDISEIKNWAGDDGAGAARAIKYRKTKFATEKLRN